MPRARPAVAGIILLVLIAQVRVDIVHSFAVSSFQSPKRKQVTNQGKTAGGFAKTSDSVPATHRKDDSVSTQTLIDFLLQWNAEGLGADAGTEVGFDTTNGIRGLYATKSFKKNEIICKIPSDVALALSDPSMATEQTTNVVAGAFNFLSWYQNNPQARRTWSAYLETLPTRDAHFDPTPDFYSDAEID